MATHYGFIVLLVGLGSLTVLPGSSGQTVAQCQYQCYRTYLQLYNYYCKWGQICIYTNYLAEFYTSCYGNCNAITTTTTTTTTTLPPYFSSKTSCGSSLVGRIVGGTVASECEFPWAVVVNIGTSFCGGSILDSNTVITAGHCVYSTSYGLTQASSISVKYGSSNQYQATRVGVIKVVVHPSFVLNVYDYDVAILTLERSLTFNTCVQPICLPNEWAEAANTQGCQAAGWGAIMYSKRTSQTQLQKVSLPIVPLAQCQAAYQSTTRISNIKVCAGDMKNGGIDSCLGDSGGPLMCLNGAVYTLYGVVSFGRGCASPGVPGVYARVSHPDILSWIKSNI